MTGAGGFKAASITVLTSQLKWCFCPQHLQIQILGQVNLQDIRHSKNRLLIISLVIDGMSEASRR
jgi:hypothetical protein